MREQQPVPMAFGSIKQAAEPHQAAIEDIHEGHRAAIRSHNQAIQTIANDANSAIRIHQAALKDITEDINQRSRPNIESLIPLNRSAAELTLNRFFYLTQLLPETADLDIDDQESPLTKIAITKPTLRAWAAGMPLHESSQEITDDLIDYIFAGKNDQISVIEINLEETWFDMKDQEYYEGLLTLEGAATLHFSVDYRPNRSEIEGMITITLDFEQTLKDEKIMQHADFFNRSLTHLERLSIVATFLEAAIEAAQQQAQSQ